MGILASASDGAEVKAGMMKLHQRSQ